MSDGSTTWTFTYDADGMRTKRTTGTQTYTYVYNSGQLSQMTKGTDTLRFSYDASGLPLTVAYNGTTYYYITNIQGDVIGIANQSGQLVVQYLYNAWGVHLETTGTMAATLGALNPLRYRGYVYDTETELYYLQSRYYNPELGRFINADAFVSTGQGLLGYNMFAYCGNNPVSRIDPTGDVFWSIVGIFCVVALVISIPSSEDQTPYKKQAAKEKYNSDTVNVYMRGSRAPDKRKINAELYVDDIENNYVNIQIDKSLEVNSTYEMGAVLDVIMESEYYSEERFGSKSFMTAQWVAHNASYKIAASSTLGYSLMQILSGSSDPLQSSNELDIRCKGNMLRRQELLYTVISWFV